MAVESPVAFAKGLSDPLQPNRLKALEQLKAWIEKSGSSHQFTSVEIDQLWRALQYTLWMADKRPVQQQVAAESVLMARSIDPSFVEEWNRGFWFNIEKIYDNIDKYRIPKFQLLIRIYVAELFHQAHTREWSYEFVSACMDHITANLSRAVGGYIQFLSVFLPELEATIESDKLKSVIKPRKVLHALLRPALYCVENAHNIPMSLLTKALEAVLTDAKIVSYSEQTKELIKTSLQKVAMDKHTSQDVRDKLYEAMEAVDVAEMPKLKKRKSTSSEQ